MSSTASLPATIPLRHARDAPSGIFPRLPSCSPTESICASAFTISAALEPQLIDQVPNSHVQHRSYVCDPPGHFLQVICFWMIAEGPFVSSIQVLWAGSLTPYFRRLAALAFEVDDFPTITADSEQSCPPECTHCAMVSISDCCRSGCSCASFLLFAS